jgi:RHS repeat-associated protein
MSKKIPLLLAFSIIFLFFDVFASSAHAQRIFYYHNDHLGSPVAITNEVGDIVWKANYKPFGGILNEQKVVGNERKYNAKEFDKDTDLYYYGARYYKADVGRFTTPDPISGNIRNPQGLNLYAYARNNPLKYIDPKGEMILFHESVFKYGLREAGITETYFGRLKAFNQLARSPKIYIVREMTFDEEMESMESTFRGEPLGHIGPPFHWGRFKSWEENEFLMHVAISRTILRGNPRITLLPMIYEFTLLTMKEKSEKFQRGMIKSYGKKIGGELGELSTQMLAYKLAMEAIKSTEFYEKCDEEIYHQYRKDFIESVEELMEGLSPETREGATERIKEYIGFDL